MFTVDELKKALGIEEDQELGKRFNVGKSAVTAWKNKGIPPKIELSARNMIEDMKAEGKTVQQTAGHKGDALVMHVTGGSVHVDTAAHVDKTHNGNHHALPVTEEEHETQKYIATTVDSLSFIKSVVAIMWDMPKDKQKKALRRVFDVDEEV